MKQVYFPWDSYICQITKDTSVPININNKHLFHADRCWFNDLCIAIVTDISYVCLLLL